MYFLDDYLNNNWRPISMWASFWLSNKGRVKRIKNKRRMKRK